MQKRPLYVYVIAVAIVLVVVNYVAWLTGGDTKLHTSELVSTGFLLGMLAMYIAVHLYTWK
jgi:hypothetical protein